MINLIENTITEALKKKFTESQIDSFPVNFEDYSFTSYDSCILIRFEDASFSSQKSITRVNSMQTYNLTVFAGIRYAMKHSESYPFLKEIKKVLNGLPILSKRLVLSRIKFEAEISGDLWYSFSVNIELPVIDEYGDLSEADKMIGVKINE